MPIHSWLKSKQKVFKKVVDKINLHKEKVHFKKWCLTVSHDGDETTFSMYDAKFFIFLLSSLVAGAHTL